MARRRRSVLSRFRSFSRNFRAVASILVGLGVVGGAGYFSMSGFTGKATTFANDLKAVVFGDGTEADVPTISLPPYEKSDTEITVGTFNIQQFGPYKLGKPKVMKALADTVRRFDVVAIQEITNINGNSLEDLVNLMNGPGSRRFDYLISTHLGNEQFGFEYAQ